MFDKKPILKECKIQGFLVCVRNQDDDNEYTFTVYNEGDGWDYNDVWSGKGGYLPRNAWTEQLFEQVIDDLKKKQIIK